MGWEFLGRSLGRSLVRPWFILGLLFGGDREGTREGNLKKSAFFSIVSMSVFSRSSLGGARERIREVNLKNSIVFC